MSFQQFFIQWLMSTYSGDDKIIYLGGSHEIDLTICIQVSTAEAEPLLRYSHEEAESCSTRVMALK